jgi:hypothetical protein
VWRAAVELLDGTDTYGALAEVAEDERGDYLVVSAMSLASVVRDG